MTSEVNVLREDEVKQVITTEEALLNAPDHDESHFLVAKVIK
jgi:aspartyl-tRNA(Asn)/glutamyl-tRNA(Gln) amidotransferase subunit C